MRRAIAIVVPAVAALSLLAACADESGPNASPGPDLATGLTAIAEAAGTDQVQRLTSDGGRVSATMVTDGGAERWTWTDGNGEVTSEEVDRSSTPEPRTPMDAATVTDTLAAIPGCAEGRSTFTLTALGDAHSQTRVECEVGTDATYYLDGEPAGPVEPTDPVALTAAVDHAAAVLGGDLAQVRMATLAGARLEVVAAEEQPTLTDASARCVPVYVVDLSGGPARGLRCATHDPGPVLETSFDAEVAVALQEQSGGAEAFDELRFSMEHGSPVYSVLSLSEEGMAWYDAAGDPLIERGRVGADLEPGRYAMVAEPTEDCTWHVVAERDGVEERVREGETGERGHVELEHGQFLESRNCPFWQAT